MSSLPLAGRAVLVTRAAHQAGKLSDGLRALGATSVEVPVLEIRPPASFEGLDMTLHQFGVYDWVIFTSANAVRTLAVRASALGIALHGNVSLKVAAIGEGTASAAREAGFNVTLVPVTYVAESLIEEWPGQLSGQKILLARSEIARDLIPDALRKRNAHVDVVDAYRNVLPDAAPDQLRQALANGVDAATFTSSSGVTHLAKAAKVAGVEWPFPGVPAVSIGPITTKTLREHGWEPAMEANPSDIPGLIAAVSRLFAG